VKVDFRSHLREDFTLCNKPVLKALSAGGWASCKKA
jgi:hypothetical protein